MAATLVVLVVGCDVLSLDKESSDLAELIEQNREAWEVQDVDTHEFTYDRRVGETETSEVHVVVRGGGD